MTKLTHTYTHIHTHTRNNTHTYTLIHTHTHTETDTHTHTHYVDNNPNTSSSISSNSYVIIFSSLTNAAYMKQKRNTPMNTKFEKNIPTEKVDDPANRREKRDASTLALQVRPTRVGSTSVDANEQFFDSLPSRETV
eukprot:GHVR01030295.1.p2 GENE.GHVR01030295.1~~GHVR01030295.1.p2  ORF type:complete len:137 (+),score=61.84 GHVR01030295.1:386-796(+)